MNFALTKEVTRMLTDAGITACIWGHRGVGKSSLVRELANEGIQVTDPKTNETVSVPIGFIDFRCGQIEASDLRGLPDKVDGRTVYLPPADLPIGDRTALSIKEELDAIKDPEQRRIRREELQVHYDEGILFLDEANRGQDDVMQAVFQLIQDRRIGQYILPRGWRIVLAGNHMQGDYNTNNFTDAAFLDRMGHVKLDAEQNLLEEWCDYMSTKHGERSVQTMTFCASNVDHWRGQVEGDLGFTVQPSPRSWERVVLIEELYSKGGYSEDARAQAIMALVGVDVGSHYLRFSCPVKPQDLIKHGVAQYKNDILKLDRQNLVGVALSFATLVRSRLLEDKVVDTALDFIELLLDSPEIKDKDVIVAFCRMCLKDHHNMAHCITNITFARAAAKLKKEKEDGGMNFITRLSKRVALHERLSPLAWGK